MTTRTRFAEVVRSRPVDLGLACLLLAAEADPSLDVDTAVTELDRLASDAAAALRVPDDPQESAAGLRRALGTEAGFRRTDAAYRGIDGSLLPTVLRQRTGLPILLSVVWLEVARRLGVPAYGVGLPGHYVVAIGDPDGVVQLVDPSSGGTLLDPGDAAVLATAASGRTVSAADVEGITRSPGDAVDLLTRVLTNLRAAAAGPAVEQLRTRLWATELTLLLPRHPLALRHERGLLLVRTGSHAAGAVVLEEYAALMGDADPAAATAARAEARTARAQLN